MGHMTVLRAIMAAAVAVRLGSAGEPEKMSPMGTQHINEARSSGGYH